MNEFELSIREGAITTNLDSLKAELSEIAERYTGLVVSEETIPQAKTDLADLRKIVKDYFNRLETGEYKDGYPKLPLGCHKK